MMPIVVVISNVTKTVATDQMGTIRAFDGYSTD
jgi:hypothetical protein